MKKLLKQLYFCVFFAALLMNYAFAIDVTEKELDLVYRLYSITAEEMDKFVTLGYGGFIDGYNESGLSIEAYYKKCLADLQNNESLSAVRQRDAEAKEQMSEYIKDLKWTRKVWQYRHLAPPLFFLSCLQK